jgi:hypothetical protein
VNADCNGSDAVHWRPFINLLALALAWTAFAHGAEAPIRDDPRLQLALEGARSAFLAGRHFDRLDVTVLVAAGDGSWRRASVGGREPWYPASCVKLAFAIAAVRWCEGAGRPADCLDESVLPMLRDSLSSRSIAAGPTPAIRSASSPGRRAR